MDQRIAYHAKGAGDPALLFVHGFGCAHDDWRRQVAALSDRFRCIALDLPGHGGSAPPPETTLAALAEAVNAVRDREAAQEVVLIGHSMGAKIVREVYSHQPEGVRGIVLVEGSLYLGERAALVARARARVDQAGFRAFAGGLFEEMFHANSDPAERERLVARAMAMDPDFGRALFLATVGWDPLRGRETLARIEVPLLLLQSTYFDADFIRRPIPPGGTASFVELVRELVPQSRIVIVPEAGHFPMLDAPEAVSGAIRDFTLGLAGRIDSRIGGAS